MMKRFRTERIGRALRLASPMLAVPAGPPGARMIYSAEQFGRQHVMTTIRSSFLLAAFLCSISAAALAQEAYTNRTANVRAGPDRSYPLVAQLGPGPIADQMTGGATNAHRPPVVRRLGPGARRRPCGAPTNDRRDATADGRRAVRARADANLGAVAIPRHARIRKASGAALVGLSVPRHFATAGSAMI
jgi:hypothetical protein